MKPATIFLDTSGLIAVLDADDRAHAAAHPVWRMWVEQDTPLLTSNYVVVETLAVLQRRYGMTAVRALYDELLPVVYVVWIDAPLHTQAVEQFLIANRYQLSLVDCTSFTLMRALGLRHVFTFDAHFAEQGFTCYP